VYKKSRTNNVVVGRLKVLRSVFGIGEDSDVALQPLASTQEIFLHDLDVFWRLDQGVRGLCPWRILVGDAQQQSTSPGRSSISGPYLKKNVRRAAERMEGTALTARLTINIGQTLRERTSLTGFPLIPRKTSKGVSVVI
jgi:hypothetical protein